VRNLILCVATSLSTLSAAASATTFTFDTDPFAGSTALTTPGRQVVGGETFISFNIAADVFALGQAAFGVGNQVLFANDVAGNLPTSGVNVIVLQSFDDDSNPATPFAAANAANLIANRITSPGPGFFIYFNQGLDLARLVFSTDLNDNTADLKILFRMTNLTGQGGRDAISTFTAANFAIIAAVPEPSVLALLAIALAGLNFARRRKLH
jgi:hypothetical protein